MNKPAGFKIPAPRTPTKHFGPNVRHRAQVIASLALAHGWIAGAELGVAEGRTAQRILRSCPSLKLICVDLWAPQPGNTGPETWDDWPHGSHEAQAKGRLNPFGDRVQIIKALTVDAAQMVADSSLDFVFIDADHSESGVRRDVRAWRPKIKAGGMLMGHDAAWPGVWQAIDAECPGYWIGPNDVWGVQV